jgi:methylated-DNA-[protein]-cysteine S-methyltransferase
MLRMAQKLADQSVELFQIRMDSPVGALVLSSNIHSIVSVQIESYSKNLMPLEPVDFPLPDCLISCKSQLREYFEGTRTRFDLPLAPSGTAFQQKVWVTLEQIPFGQTITYLDLARQLGDPKVIRAAGSANGKNPIAIIIPCHRVIGSNGGLVGYAGGMENKKWLLDHEQKCSGGVTQMSFF